MSLLFYIQHETKTVTYINPDLFFCTLLYISSNVFVILIICKTSIDFFFFFFFIKIVRYVSVLSACA
uniref:Uncharacterized protein n=1 Tax=Pyxicephalus adspersus TaxID=30357 RepID=A0AAV3B1Z6_PYXAD|nr:TPA: hypothetical protein GDO54_008956 [Pyxicephalus adspersus]